VAVGDFPPTLLILQANCPMHPTKQQGQHLSSSIGMYHHDGHAVQTHQPALHNAAQKSLAILYLHKSLNIAGENKLTITNKALQGSRYCILEKCTIVIMVMPFKPMAPFCKDYLKNSAHHMNTWTSHSGSPGGFTQSQ